MLAVMTLRAKKAPRDPSDADLRDELARRGEALDRGEGLTTEELARRLTKRRADALVAEPAPKTGSRPSRG